MSRNITGNVIPALQPGLNRCSFPSRECLGKPYRKPSSLQLLFMCSYHENQRGTISWNSFDGSPTLVQLP